MSEFLARISKLSPKRLALLAMDLQSRLEALEKDKKQPNAIVGMGCRFPGGAHNPAAFWRLLRDGVDAITEVPRDRWDLSAYYDPDPDAPGKMNTKYGGFLDHIDHFDPHFFGIAPREAARIDPQQRLLLEVSWEALENAALAPEKLEGSDTGVFIGISDADYSRLLMARGQREFDVYSATGTALSIAAGRLSYVLGLRGPSLLVDTACSSSLVAIHLACLSLRAGECHTALAGGVNAMITPDVTIMLSKGHMMASDGRCKTFDASANGYVRGEGCGIIVLKRLADALSDGDNVIAVIEGSAVNQDGKSSGITAPNGPSQEAVIQRALSLAGIEPAQVGYVETHGTGTELGDPIEVNALAAVLGRGRQPDNRLKIGSVKTNIGHLESAAGVAGLIKLVLALQHKQIPPHLHLQKLNPYIAWDEIPIDVPTQLTPWSAVTGKLVGGLSSFGFSGTNAHIIVSEAPTFTQPSPVSSGSPSIDTSHSQERPQHILALSAKNENALEELADHYESHLQEHPEPSLGDLCFTANTGRSHFTHRLALIAGSNQELQEKLRAFHSGNVLPGMMNHVLKSTQPSEVVFLFTGQGSQYVGMGRQLYETQPVFRRALDQCDEILRVYLEKPLLSVLYPASVTSNQLSVNSNHSSMKTGNWALGTEDRSLSSGNLLDQTAYTQPAVFALQYALTELWRAWGIEPAAVMGHSAGEYAAACVAGVFGLEDGLKLAVERGRMAQKWCPKGTMAVIMADEARAAAAIAPYANAVAIAAINGPDNTVLSGAVEPMQEIIKQLDAEGIKTKVLPISHAFHSPVLEPMLPAFEQVAATVKHSRPQIGLVSNLTGQFFDFGFGTADGGNFSSAIRNPQSYWRRHARETVKFSTTIETLYRQGYRLFVEIGPTPTVLSMGSKCIDAVLAKNADQEPINQADAGVWLPSLRHGKDDWQQMLESLTALYVHGVPVDWAAFDRGFPRRKLLLPTYPFQRDRYWIDDRVTSASEDHAPLFAQRASHPLLGHKLRSPLHIFEMQLSRALLAGMDDHRALGVSVVPAAVYLELALAAVEESLPGGNAAHILEEITIPEAIVLPEDASCTAQLILQPQGNEDFSFNLSSIDNAEAGTPGTWRLHATGKIRAVKNLAGSDELLIPAQVQARCAESPLENFYERLEKRGLHANEHGQRLARLWRRDGEALGRIEINAELRAQLEGYQLHPAVLDASLQLLEATLPTNGKLNAEGSTFVMVGLDRCCFYRRPTPWLWSQASFGSNTDNRQEILKGNVRLFDEAGNVVAKLDGLQFKRVTLHGLLGTSRQLMKDWFYEVQWQAQPQPSREIRRLSADDVPAPNKIAATLQPLIPQLYAENELRLYDEMLPRLEELCSAYVQQAFTKLGVEFKLGQRLSVDRFMTQCRVQSKYCRLVERLFLMLHEDGWLARRNGEWEVIKDSAWENTGESLHELMAQFPACSGELTLVGRCGQRLAEVLRGEQEPLQLLFPEGSMVDAEKLYEQSPAAKLFNLLVRNAVVTALENLPAGRIVRILEIGAGTGGTTSFVLPVLPADRVEYVFTDVGQIFTLKAAEKFRAYPFVRYQLLDIGSDPMAQGFAPHQFDLIIAANVLHATCDLRGTLTNVQRLLSSDGLLILLEATVPTRLADLTVGLTDGWWSFADTDLRPSYALLTQDLWQTVLQEMGFTEVAMLPEARGDSALSKESVILARGPHVEEKTPTSAILPGHWLILADGGGVGAQLRELLCARGESCTLIHAADFRSSVAEDECKIEPAHPADFDMLLKIRPPQPWRGIIHLWGLDGNKPDDAPVEVLEAAVERGCRSALYLLQAMVRAELPEKPRLWLVTRGAQPVSHAPISVAQSSLLGLGRVLAMEHPEIFGGLVDLSREHFADEIPLLLAEILASPNEDQVAFRGRERYVARLVRSQNRDISTAPLRLHEDATYMITGGMGGMGLEIARWMVESGARHLVLIGRRAPSEHASEKIDELKTSGAQVRVAQIDISQPDQVAGLFADLEQTMPPLRGIMHAAGVFDDSVLVRHDWERFAKVLAPKVRGGWILHSLTRQMKLDFFVLFSSSAALWGAAGEGNYVAANAFLDALAHYRRQLGLPALSLNWGPWSQVGMAKAVGVSRENKWQSLGLNAFTPEQGLEALEALLQQHHAQVAVLSMDWPKFFQQFPAIDRKQFFAEMFKEARTSPAAVKPRTKPRDILQRIEQALPKERLDVLAAYVREQVMHVLGLSSSFPLEPHHRFFELGMDSLTSIELKNRLQADFKRSFPATLVIDYPSVETLAGYLGREVLKLSATQKDSDANAQADAEPGVQDLEGLSLDEMKALLDEELTAVDRIMEAS